MQEQRIPILIWEAEAQALYAAGLSYKEVAIRVGKSYKQVYRVLNREKLREAEKARRPAKREWDRKKAAERRLAAGIIEPEPCPGVLWIRDRHGRVISMTIVDLPDWHRYKDKRMNYTAGYASWSENGRTVYLHRELLGLKHGENRKERQADHINRFRLDNRRANLRIVSAKENCANRGGVYADAA
jgi:hypothetical protein